MLAGLVVVLCLAAVGLLVTLPSASAEEGARLTPAPIDPGKAKRIWTVEARCVAASSALTALLKSRRDDASIQRLQNLNTESTYEGMLIYDFQYPFTTEGERSHARTSFLDHAENLRKDAERESIWYFTRNTSNWVITFMSDYAAQRILWPGIMFSDDPRAPALRQQGVTLLKYFMEKGPRMLEESLTVVNGYGVWDLSLGGLLFISAHRHRDLSSFDPLEFNGRVLRGDGILRTYAYLTIDSLKGKGKVVDDTTYDMPGPYWMAAKMFSVGKMTSQCHSPCLVDNYSGIGQGPAGESSLGSASEAIVGEASS